MVTISSRDLNKIMNHIAKSNDELGVVQSDISRMKADIEWLKKFQWLILTTAIGSLVLQLVSGVG